MIIDQDWVEENIDDIMNIFLATHTQFKSKDNVSRMAKSRHKKHMLENMDTMNYRPIYYIARSTKIKELKLRKIIREQNEKIKHLETSNHANGENLKIYKDKSCKLASDTSTLRSQSQRQTEQIKRLLAKIQELENFDRK